MHDSKPNPLEVAIFLILMILAFAAVGQMDYQDELERENRTLRATAERCQLAQSLRLGAQVEEAGHGQP